MKKINRMFWAITTLICILLAYSIFRKQEIVCDLLLTAATVLLAYVAYVQLMGISDTDKEKFSWKFNRVFFNRDNRNIFMLIDENILKIGDIEYNGKNKNLDNLKRPYFFVKEDKISQKLIKINDENNEYGKKIMYSCYEIDDYLGLFEEMAKFEKKGLLDFVSIKYDFGYYIEKSWENPEIRRNVEWMRMKEKDNSYYSGFQRLYDRSKKSI